MTNIQLPEVFHQDIYLARKEFVGNTAKGIFNPAKLFELSNRLSPMLATYGPAGCNISPFMISFVPYKEHLAEINKKIREFIESPMPSTMQQGAQFLLEHLYKDEIIDHSRYITHLMNLGHTFENVKDNGNVSIGILIPPDKAAYEIRTKAEIFDTGDYYDFANLAHDIMHRKPHGEHEHHPWCPALVMSIQEIYDNSYKAISKKIF
jgi:hypothetical protein